ncbi:hypothetical protein [Actinomadura napierensis]|uniref:Uncharacterized protein n=1 Tax=Actinomadura napierensis TaxID=267854 RepID=A0ABP5KSX8_9ACTN
MAKDGHADVVTRGRGDGASASTPSVPDALVFTGIKDGPLRRSGFNKVTRWRAVPNLRFHDHRHAGNALDAGLLFTIRLDSPHTSRSVMVPVRAARQEGYPHRRRGTGPAACTAAGRAVVYSVIPA